LFLLSEPVGFIGVGAMGSAIAGRLVDSYELRVNDRNPAAADDLVSSGAKFSSVEEIADTCKFVFLSLPGPNEVTGLLLGSEGLAHQLSPGTVVIDTSTSTPTVDDEIVQALESRGVRFCDAPIAGGVGRAKAGTAALMVGASDETFAEVKELLDTITSEVIHVGPPGAGHTMKLVNNLLNSCNRFAAMECVLLGVAGGVDLEVVIDVLNKSSARNYATEMTFPALVPGYKGGEYPLQGFTLQLMQKDIRLANELAEALDHRTPIGHLVQDFAQTAIDRFGGNADQARMMVEWYDR
jgi:3-hydroxyisobutyrate dehydrogenase